MCGIGIRTETRIFEKNKPKKKKNQRANGQLTTSSDLCYLEPFSELEPEWNLEFVFLRNPSQDCQFHCVWNWNQRHSNLSFRIGTGDSS
jgi:hypothetical protein